MAYVLLATHALRRTCNWSIAYSVSANKTKS